MQSPRAIRSKRVQAIEKRHGEPLEEILRKLYYDEGLTQAEVAKRLRVPAGSIGGWLIRFGINQRTLAGQAAKELAS
jgi:DNA-binding transcriptional regulator LsrR (DeoR family)